MSLCIGQYYERLTVCCIIGTTWFSSIRSFEAAQFTHAQKIICHQSFAATAFFLLCSVQVLTENYYFAQLSPLIGWLFSFHRMLENSSGYYTL